MLLFHDLAVLESLEPSPIGRVSPAMLSMIHEALECLTVYLEKLRFTVLAFLKLLPSRAKNINVVHGEISERLREVL